MKIVRFVCLREKFQRVIKARRCYALGWGVLEWGVGASSRNPQRLPAAASL